MKFLDILRQHFPDNSPPPVATSPIERQGWGQMDDALYLWNKADPEPTLGKPVEVWVTIDTQSISGDEPLANWLAQRDAVIVSLEQLRRCPQKGGAVPVVGVVDYAAAGQAIELAMQALDEALPNGQQQRIEVAMQLLEMGHRALKTWVEAKYTPNGIVKG